MRIVIAGDRHWGCLDLAERVVNRLVVRYGPNIVIIHGGYPGVDQSFAVSCHELGVTAELCLVDFSHLGDHRLQNREMLRRGADLCLIVHRTPLDDASKDLARQAIEARVHAYLIDDDQGTPRRLEAVDPRLA
jgi:YspA, cpYpsA-related SLOG family